MIKYSDRFEFERDQYGWTLYEWREGISRKTKQPIRTARKTHHSNLSQVCGQIIDRSAGDCETLEQVINMISATREEMASKC